MLRIGKVMNMVQAKEEKGLVRVWLADDILDGLVNCGRQAG